jgi:hypothetical protein
VFNDVSTLIDVLFPKFELDWGYYILFDGDLTFF